MPVPIWRYGSPSYFQMFHCRSGSLAANATFIKSFLQRVLELVFGGGGLLNIKGRKMKRWLLCGEFREGFNLDYWFPLGRSYFQAGFKYIRGC